MFEYDVRLVKGGPSFTMSFHAPVHRFDEISLRDGLHVVMMVQHSGKKRSLLLVSPCPPEVPPMDLRKAPTPEKP